MPYQESVLPPSATAGIEEKLGALIEQVSTLTARVSAMERGEFTGFREPHTLSAEKSKSLKQTIAKSLNNSHKGVQPTKAKLDQPSEQVDVTSQRKTSIGVDPSIGANGVENVPVGGHPQVPHFCQIHGKKMVLGESRPEPDVINVQSFSVENQENSSTVSPDPTQGTAGENGKPFRVVFASPPVTPADPGLIPEGWMVFKDGMALGMEPNTIVFSDGGTYGPQTVEVDTTSFSKPVWRYKRVRGTKPKVSKGVIPVREAFEALLSFLADQPASAREWEGTSFSPHGAHANRSFSVELNDSSLGGHFFANATKWFQEIFSNAKPNWEEATVPANVVPLSFSSISPENYAKTFSAKPFAPNEGATFSRF